MDHVRIRVGLTTKQREDCAPFSWNIHGRRGKWPERQIAAVTARAADVVGLQEVRTETLDVWVDGLRSAGYIQVIDSADGLSIPAPSGRDYRRCYFNLIAARWPVEPLPGLSIAFPERYLAASLRHPGGSFELHVAHLPPGSTRGLLKVEMFEALYRRLAVAAPVPRILCGDFNTPRSEAVDGAVEFWGSRHPRYKQRWDAAERSVVLGLAEFDLRDVFRAVNGYGDPDASWVLKRTGQTWGRRYDHVFAADNLRATRREYVHSWRKDGLSDHSAIEAEFDHPTLG